MNATSTNAATLCAAFCFSILLNVVHAQVPSAAPTIALPAPTATASTGALYAAIGDKPAIIYDAPSGKAQKTFILSRQHPVEILVKLDKWIKIRDAENTVGWVESTSLGTIRTVQVSVNNAEIRVMPNPNAAIAFEAARLVVLDATGPAVNGWLPVRHRDGQTGYASKSQVWGD